MGELAAGGSVAHYRLIERLGEGGMGVVWHAIDTRLERPVALKLLHESHADDPERLRLMSQEARAVAALNHPGIVTLFAIEDTLHGPCLVMELIDGSTLESTIIEGGLSLQGFFAIALPLARALAAAHAAGVVHGDLKPANVLYHETAGTKVLDFGLARCRSHHG